MENGRINICIVRHGITVNNVKGCFGGRTDFSLTSEGKSAISDMVKQYPYPKVEWVVSSPSLRCIETAQLAFPGMEYEIMEDLIELYFGDFENVSASKLWEKPEYYKKWAEQELDFSFPNGETLGECLERAEKAFRLIINKAADRHYENIGVVTHSVVISLVLRKMLKELPDRKNLFCPNGMGLMVYTYRNEISCDKPLRFEKLLPEGAPRPDMSESPYVKK